MEKIRIHSASDKTYPNLGRYLIVDASMGKHRVIVSCSKSEIRVIVQNASNRAWNRMTGKAFRNAAEAVAAYKTPAIRTLVEQITAAGPVPA